jgi:glycosyl transferase family 25
MRIFFINLARAADRRRNMERQLAAFGLDFERIEATDGQNLSMTDRALVDDDKRRWITPYPLSDNEIGCWLSHRHALQQIAEGEDARAAVIEDDAELTPDFPRVIAAIEQQQPAFDFIFLHRKFKKGEQFVPCKPLLPDLSLGRVGPAHMGAIGYVVSKRGAEKFLAYAPRFAHALDKEIHRYWANGLDIYGLERPVVVHADEGHSFIEETREQDRPAARPRYPQADRLIWRFARAMTRFSDSARKRLAWPLYVRKGKWSQ